MIIYLGFGWVIKTDSLMRMRLKCRILGKNSKGIKYAKDKSFKEETKKK